MNTAMIEKEGFGYQPKTKKVYYASPDAARPLSPAELSDRRYGHELLVELFSGLEYKCTDGSPIPNAEHYQKGSDPFYDLHYRWVRQ